MPLRKIRDIQPPCTHSEHNPPGDVVLEPGEYEYICPGCGRVIKFIIQGFYCGSKEPTILWSNPNNEATLRGKPISYLTNQEYEEYINHYSVIDK